MSRTGVSLTPGGTPMESELAPAAPVRAVTASSKFGFEPQPVRKGLVATTAQPNQSRIEHTGIAPSAHDVPTDEIQVYGYRRDFFRGSFRSVAVSLIPVLAHHPAFVRAKPFESRLSILVERGRGAHAGRDPRSPFRLGEVWLDLPRRPSLDSAAHLASRGGWGAHVLVEAKRMPG